ncbi:MAG TPA: DUF1743 domain-containing protein, partial [Thermoplasmata archaeon]|nr:DUF1743 domain-containing protein [Thermoplasmata archaeon]
MWIGIDDTDAPGGGCTTFVLTEILRAARSVGADLLGEPRLVRLDPNIPWKTRGNAALAAHFGRGTGERRRLGELPDGTVWSHARGRPLLAPTGRRLLDAAWEVVERTSVRARGTDPALVACARRPPTSLYRSAVRSVVRVADVDRLLRSLGASVRVRGSRRGIVGAAAALAWPARRVTWELIAYRAPSETAARRAVDPESVREVERRHPQLFQCTDPRTRRVLISPHTACPILFGLRSTDPSVLPGAMREIRSEAVERWVVFRTNQATGDHLTDRAIGDLEPYGSGRFLGTVASLPERRRGGHVRFVLADRLGERLACLAFEPTKTLPKVAASLVPGDRVEVWGGRGRDATLRLEGI